MERVNRVKRWMRTDTRNATKKTGESNWQAASLTASQTAGRKFSAQTERLRSAHVYSKRTPSKFHGKSTSQQAERLISQQIDTLLLSADTCRETKAMIATWQAFNRAAMHLTRSQALYATLKEIKCCRMTANTHAVMKTSAQPQTTALITFKCALCKRQPCNCTS